MRRDPTEFRRRFQAYKEGKMPYDAGRPVAIQEVDKSDADFAKRLRSNWRQEIWDWEGSGKSVTHKIAGADNIVYPNVQTTKGGGLIDFTNPIWKGNVDPFERAIKNNDYVPMKTEQDAIWFGPNYKNYYPGFKNGKLPGFKDGANGWVRTNGNDIKFDEETGELVDQVTGEKGTMMLPEITIKPRHYDAYNSAYDQDAVNSFIQFIDPTGITNIPNVIISADDFYHNPSLAGIADLGISLASAMPYAGKFSNISKILPNVNYIKLFGNIIKTPGRKLLSAAANTINNFSNDVFKYNPNIGKKFIDNVQNASVLSSRIYKDTPTNISNAIASKFLENSGGYTGFNLADGQQYTGTYRFPAKPQTEGLIFKTKSTYGGKNADINRNLVQLYLTGNDAGFDKIRDNEVYKLGDFSHIGNSYTGKLLPIKKDNSPYNIPIKNKDFFDKLIDANRTLRINQNTFNTDPDTTVFGNQTLDNTRTLNIKPVLENGKYYIDASKVWDFKNSTGFWGDLIEIYKRTRNLPSAPILRQRMPINFTDDSVTPEWTMLNKAQRSLFL